MQKLLLIGGLMYLLSRKPINSGGEVVNAQTEFPQMEGGKNLVFNKLPINEYGLPIAVHVYAQDFPLVEGDFGSVIAVLQQMVNANDFGFTLPVTGIYDSATHLAYFSSKITLDQFIQTATSTPPIVGKVEVYEFKPGA